ncbi:L-selectin-like [Sardina pilchardus]|uniref:L-selectin-like n=1 Tax=Sardina pilchardus TaxID=27697 RepID=UPI002E13A09B
MTLLLITTLLLSGLVSLSSSVPHQFHVVKEQKNWSEAQQYCREKFTDLATIDDMTEMEKVKSKIHEAGAGDAWIGLKRGDWQWSLADRDFYRENEAEFRNWNPGGDSTHPYVLVTDSKNWTDAQSYCRENHTDLASVRNQAENDQVEQVRRALGRSAYFGLFRAAWSEWSDGSSSSFRYWNSGEPNNVGVVCTVIMPSGQWKDEDCGHPRPFICYRDIDECARDSSTCGPNAACSNTQGSFSCACNQGYQKPPRVTITNATNPCQDTDECARDSSTCGPNAVCSNTQGSFSCACNEGYQKPPGVTITNATNPCQDTDECARDSSLCGPNAVCTNTKGSFSCACNEGYEKPPGVTITNATNPCQEPEVKRQIVRVKFPVESGVDMNDPDTLKAVLKQMQKRLGLPADAKLSWKKQPDGKIFKKQKEKKKEEGRKRRKRTEL